MKKTRAHSDLLPDHLRRELSGEETELGKGVSEVVVRLRDLDVLQEVVGSTVGEVATVDVQCEEHK
jgi:hypothetical protein